MNLKSFKYIKVFLLFDKNISTLQPPIGLKEERCLQMSSLQKFWHSKRQKSFAVVFEEMIDWEKNGTVSSPFLLLLRSLFSFTFVEVTEQIHVNSQTGLLTKPHIQRWKFQTDLVQGNKKKLKFWGLGVRVEGFNDLGL